MKKFAALFLSLLLSLSLAAPAALCAGEEPLPTVLEEPVIPTDPEEPGEPDEPLRPMDDTPDNDIVTL